MKTHLPACSDSLLFSFFLDYNVSNQNLPFCFLTKSDVPQTDVHQMSLICLIILDVFLKFSLGFPNKVAFERCFVQQNVTKYGASAPVAKRRRSLHANLLEKWTPIHVFSEEFDHKFRTAILKNKSRWFFLTAQNLKLFGFKRRFSVILWSFSS